MIVAPAHAQVGAQITIRAKGLIPGRYGVYLAQTENQRPGARATVCFAPLAPPRRVGSQALFTGRIPASLTCRVGAGASIGRIKTGPGRFRLLVASPIVPGAFSGTRSFLKRTITID